MAVPVQITFDANAPGALSGFWALALGYRLDDPPPGFDSWPDALRAMDVPEEHWDDASAIVDPDGRGPRIFFQKVPEGKTVKNRVHLDVNAGRLGAPDDTEDPDRRKQVEWVAVQAHVEALVAAGATRVQERTGQFGEHFWVMADPEGNEFCVQ
ncbi:VOC family protein [Nakamurella leprariae]|uniref:VOC family protein n=1 Tax=Nakamurella leprariae TaxID=2803911 RepID=A0A939C161_9ACTN|nr:VOC family protein [Nakamurella leprariae]MBM9466794.1 VOC family protein [Nakamurella leprariae]